MVMVMVMVVGVVLRADEGVAVEGTAVVGVGTSGGFRASSAAVEAPPCCPSPPSTSLPDDDASCIPSVRGEGEGDDADTTPGNPRNNDMITGCIDAVERARLFMVLALALLPPFPFEVPTTVADDAATGGKSVPVTSCRSCLMLHISTARTALRQCSVTCEGRGRRVV